MNQTQNIPWKRISIEAVAIVASILLAFAIDAWWSDRQTRQIVQENLDALKVELDDNLREIDFESRFRKAVIASIEKLNGAGVNANTYSPQEVDSLLGHLTWIGRANVSIGAMESALQSSIFTEIEDSELQRKIAALPDLYRSIEQVEIRDAEYTVNQYYAYLNKNGSYNQIVNADFVGRPGTGDLQSNRKFRETLPRDHVKLLESDEFLGMLTIMHGNHSDVILMHDRLRTSIEEVIGLIERQKT